MPTPYHKGMLYKDQHFLSSGTLYDPRQSLGDQQPEVSSTGWVQSSNLVQLLQPDFCESENFPMSVRRLKERIMPFLYAMLNEHKASFNIREIVTNYNRFSTIRDNQVDGPRLPPTSNCVVLGLYRKIKFPGDERLQMHLHLDWSHCRGTSDTHRLAQEPILLAHAMSCIVTDELLGGYARLFDPMVAIRTHLLEADTVKELLKGLKELLVRAQSEDWSQSMVNLLEAQLSFTEKGDKSNYLPSGERRIKAMFSDTEEIVGRHFPSMTTKKVTFAAPITPEDYFAACVSLAESDLAGRSDEAWDLTWPVARFLEANEKHLGLLKTAIEDIHGMKDTNLTYQEMVEGSKILRVVSKAKDAPHVQSMADDEDRDKFTIAQIEILFQCGFQEISKHMSDSSIGHYDPSINAFPTYLDLFEYRRKVERWWYEVARTEDPPTIVELRATALKIAISMGMRAADTTRCSSHLRSLYHEWWPKWVERKKAMREAEVATIPKEPAAPTPPTNPWVLRGRDVDQWFSDAVKIEEAVHQQLAEIYAPYAPAEDEEMQLTPIEVDETPQNLFLSDAPHCDDYAY